MTNPLIDSLLNLKNLPVSSLSGSSSVIGKATAIALAYSGYDLAICARRQDRLTTIAGQLEAAGSQVLAKSVDLRDESQILRFFEAVEEVVHLPPFLGVSLYEGVQRGAGLHSEESGEVG